MDKITAVLGELPTQIVTMDQDIIAKYVVDFRRLFTGRSRAVLRPRSIEDVQQVARTCYCHGVPLVPQGGNTIYCTAATPGTSNDELN